MATKPTYRVTDKSPLHYAGKVALPGEEVTDIPGESIGWLLKEGFIFRLPDEGSEGTTPVVKSSTAASSDLSESSTGGA